MPDVGKWLGKDGVRRRALAAVLILLVLLIVLALLVGRFRHGLDETAALASWAVAAGTLILALATFELASRAREEAEAVRKEAVEVGSQVQLQREQMEAATRAYVYASIPADWAAGIRRNESLPLKNGGPGLALNVRGRAVWNTAPGAWIVVEIYASSIAPNDDVHARLSRVLAGGWQDSTGFVRYGDLNGDDWVTYFRFDLGEGNQLVGEHLQPQRVTPDGDPDRLDPAGIAAKMPR